MDLGIVNHASLGPESGNFRDIHRPEVPNFRTVCRLARARRRSGQIEAVACFKRQHADKAAQALKRLQEVVEGSGNTFAELMDNGRDCSLGQITQALYEVGGRYRRRM